MPRLSKISLFLILLIFCLTSSIFGQSWKPATEGILKSYQWAGSGRPSGFDIKFKPNGPLNQDWIYGHWLDSDSLVRCVGYRKGGKWISLPFYANSNSWAGDIVQYGDTMYIGGYFDGVILEKDSSSLPFSTLLKFHNDSIWRSNSIIGHLRDMEVNGDTLLVLGDLYSSTHTYLLGPHIMNVAGAGSWQYPYSVPHPGNVFGIGGVWDNIEVRNGDIYAINFAESEYDGLVKWDGQQWHTFGPGIFGTVSQVYDYQFYDGEIYITGSFTKSEDSRNPGEHIAKWNGSSWETVGGGSPSPGLSMFEYNNVLYCHIGGDQFGDAKIPYFAGWNGYEWCGTPIEFSGGDPPLNFGFCNDTLFSVYTYPPDSSSNGDPIGYINYFDGDYTNNTNTVCSTLGIGEDEHSIEKTGISIYPNPTTSTIQIELLDPTHKVENVKVYDCTGRCVINQQLKPDLVVDGKVQVHLNTLAKGIYTITLNETYNAKVIKL